ERFILLAVPALLLAGAIAASLGCRALYRELSDRLPLGSARCRLRTAGALVAVVALAGVVTTPAFDAARAVAGAPVGEGEDWRAAGELIRGEAGSGRVAVGASDPLAALFYWGGADF